MKKCLIIISALMLTLAASAQEKEWHYKNYINVYKSNGTLNLKCDAGVLTGGYQSVTGDFKGHYGFGGSIGHTYYVGKPIANDFRFGIEATWLDFNYSKYDKENVEYSKLSVGMGVGVSMTYQPVQDLNIKAYLQVLPVNFGALDSKTDNSNEDVTTHVTYHATAAFGINAFYKNIGIGGEYRYTDISNVSLVELSALDCSASDYRIFLQLRF